MHCSEGGQFLKKLSMITSLTVNADPLFNTAFAMHENYIKKVAVVEHFRFICAKNLSTIQYTHRKIT